MSCGVCLDLQGCFNSFIYSSFFSSLCYSLELPTEIKARRLAECRWSSTWVEQSLWAPSATATLSLPGFTSSCPNPTGTNRIPTCFLVFKEEGRKKKKEKSPSRLIHSRVASGTCVEGRLDLRGDFICFPLLSACSKESLEIFELLFINTQKTNPKPQPQTNPKL